MNDLLLMCMVAACRAGHVRRTREKFSHIFEKAAPYIFMPFFTLTGARTGPV